MGIGAKATWDSAAKVKIGEDGKVSDIGGITWVGELLGDITTSGAGGLDTGSKSNDTWYAVYVIDGDGVSPAALFSLSFDSPTLPGSYDKKVLVWAAKVDDAGEIMKFYQTGKGTKRCCWYDVGTANARVLDSGNSTSWTTVDCSKFTPPVCDLVHVQLKFATGKTGSAADDARIRCNGALNSQASPAVGVVSAKLAAFQLTCPCDEAQKIEYKVDDTANECTIVVRGWDLDL